MLPITFKQVVKEPNAKNIKNILLKFNNEPVNHENIKLFLIELFKLGIQNKYDLDNNLNLNSTICTSALIAAEYLNKLNTNLKNYTRDRGGIWCVDIYNNKSIITTTRDVIEKLYKISNGE